MNQNTTSDDDNYNDEPSSDEDADGGNDINPSDESEYASDSDTDDKYLDVSNQSMTPSSETTESENTTHSYSNSLLESEEEDEDEIDNGDDADVSSQPSKDYSVHELSDLNNGKFCIGVARNRIISTCSIIPLCFRQLSSNYIIQ